VIGFPARRPAAKSKRTTVHTPGALPSLLLISALVLAGCGSDHARSPAQHAVPKKDRTLKILETAGGVDSIDPGRWYEKTDQQLLGQTTQRWLYSWKPNDKAPTPDIATDFPHVSDGGKTLTIKIRSGIRYSAPLDHRTVKSADVEYALERCFLRQVGNDYARYYYGGIRGVSAFRRGKARRVSGIQAPDRQTLVIRTTRPQGVLATGAALGMPCTAPVPKDYAKRYDKGRRSTYGEHQVFTGPYMIQNDGRGNVTGYERGRRLVIVRNPSWTRADDIRGANFDRIEAVGNFSAATATKRTLRGANLLSGDYVVPPATLLKAALARKKSQTAVTPTTGTRYISLNTKVPPFDDVNVRRALSAAIDRTVLRRTAGGPSAGKLATHLLPPGIYGFETAGGQKGPGYDFVSSPRANLKVATRYLRRAGYPRGRYDGPPVFAVAGSEPSTRRMAEAVRSQLKKIGIRLQLRTVPYTTMLQRYCQVPSAKVAICPSLARSADFFSAQTMIDPLFNGRSILPSGNLNTAQVHNRQLDVKIPQIRMITDPVGAGEAWAELDREITRQSYVVAWLWDNRVALEGRNVQGVSSLFNAGAWDLTASSLK
jgi:peptide/nickel transport system substrate-binding protein